MADGQHGGYRKPSRPAAVSGPGSLSARTDGAPTEMPPLAQASTPSAPEAAPAQGAAGAGANPRDGIPGLHDPSARPDEPVTAGVAIGPGIGPVGAGLAPPVTIDARELAPLIARLDVLSKLSSVTAETRAWARVVREQLGTKNY